MFGVENGGQTGCRSAVLTIFLKYGEVVLRQELYDELSEIGKNKLKKTILTKHNADL